ncbi:G2-specific protein kinase fin1 [Fulvia fulva]|uniref:G2-specific protein kinase fin1 n=1 Tax=Passalora fulva TaxID=5499 RepID=A0A9Q8LGQ3_PASFU|nr:G2-specific protein kinase fin1 [Fulvia fulva]KAK4626633.1 G2-specific protein kinase fin1 [Fulvia fulva]KAK4628101.1 G2-specific protein kinase fin1 [Fulvia fulva]UJO17137.1 G2-specific protein kinase fin1 [Fulvia fulva]WPV13674.1 G2-specific protein kinase fin1 [Fulvia fulva]WPV28279.1 G2-specific protein kinase fin1 [Fulvia fulva]
MESPRTKKARLNAERQTRLDARQAAKNKEAAEPKAGGTKRKAKGEGGNKKKAPRRGKNNQAEDQAEEGDGREEGRDNGPGAAAEPANNDEHQPGEDAAQIEDDPEDQPTEQDVADMVEPLGVMSRQEKEADLARSRLAIREQLAEGYNLEDKDHFLDRYNLVSAWFRHFAAAGRYLRVPDRRPAQSEILAHLVANNPRKAHIMRSFNTRKSWATPLAKEQIYIPDLPVYATQQPVGAYPRQLDESLDNLRNTRWATFTPRQRRMHIAVRWGELETDLYLGTQNPSAVVVAMMKQHYKWARHLAASGLYHRKPPVFYGDDQDLDEYMATLRNVMHTGKGVFYSAWLAAANSVAKSGDYEDRLLQKRIQCLAGDHTPLGEDPPVQCRCELDNASDRAWRLAWKIVNRQMAVRNASREDQMRLTALEDMAEEDRELYNELIWPPLWQPDVDHFDYLALLQQAVFEARRSYIVQAWNAAILEAKDAGNVEDIPRLQQNAKKAQTLYTDYRCRWRPPRDEPPPAVNCDSQAQAEEMGFDGGRSGISGTWKYKGELGKGAWGLVSIWVKFDADDRPVDRVAIKKVDLGPKPDIGGKPTEDRWDESWNWLGDPKRRIPIDYGLVKPLNDLPDSENVVRVVGYGVYDMRRTIQIYLEYCEHGDLAKLVQQYEERRNDPIHAGRNDRIPIRYLWSIFEALVSAACLMNHGQLPDGPPAPATAGWQALIHRDIKPANIFFAKPHATKWPGIPTAKLGDFGLGALQSDPNSARPGVGSEGFQAPEQYFYAAEDPPRPDLDGKAVSHKSDIWAIAKNMMNLINLQWWLIWGKYSENWEPEQFRRWRIWGWIQDG